MAAPLTTADAEAYVASQNSRNISKVPSFLGERFQPVYVFNIYNRAHRVQLGSLGDFYIPACEPGMPYSKPCVIKGFIADYYMANGGQGDMAWNAEQGADVAKDVVGIGSYSAELSTMTTNREWWGVFIAAGEIPTQTEVDHARVKLEQNMKMWLAEGDRLAMGGEKGRQQIQSPHIEAAVYLNQPREWANPVRALVECPGCGTPTKPYIAKCPNCSAILDREKAIKLGLIPPDSATDTPQAAPATPQKVAAK